MGAGISRKTRNRFKEHRLVRDPRKRVIKAPWINEGRPSTLFRCQGCAQGKDCTWLGWIPVEEVTLLGKLGD